METHAAAGYATRPILHGRSTTKGPSHRGTAELGSGHRATDVVCPMYPQIADIVALGRGPARTGGP